MTAGEKVVECLAAAGVKTVFGVPATHLNPVHLALQAKACGVRHVTMRHESGAGFAAEGHARATGEVAAALVTTGVGVTNTLTAMAVAKADSIPMLVLSSEVPQFWEARGARQFSHYVPDVGVMAGPVTKKTFSVKEASQLGPTLIQACALASSGRPGPVYVGIPSDLLKSSIPSYLLKSSLISDTLRDEAQADPSMGAALAPTSRAALFAFATRLLKCESPLIIAGGGAVGAEAEVLALAEAVGAPVLTTVAAKGAIDERHGLSAGCRLHTPAARDHLLKRADLLVLVGTQLSPTDFWHFSDDCDLSGVLQLQRLQGAVAHIDTDEESLIQGGVAEAGGVTVLETCREACQYLHAEIARMKQAKVPAEARWGGDPKAAVCFAKRRGDDKDAMSQNHGWDFSSASSGGEQMRQTLASLRRVLPEDAQVISDVCRLGYTALSLFPAYSAKSFLYPVGTTCLGYGLPAAVGAALAQPGKPVALLVGDGGLQFSMQELAVAVEQKLPLLIVLWNDAAFGEIRRAVGAEMCSWSHETPNWGQICSAYGIKHFRAMDSEDIEVALKAPEISALAAGRNGPVMLEMAREWDAPARGLRGARSSEPRSVVPKPILGTMTFGWEQSSTHLNDGASAEILGEFVAGGGREVDSARLYAGGVTEQILGRCLGRTTPVAAFDSVRVATKANPDEEAGTAEGTGGLAPERLARQLNSSLEALQAEQVDAFYLHWPDRETPLEETLGEVQRLYDQGKFTRFGLSNFSAWEVDKVHRHMGARGWVAPSVYQGMYNVLTRDIEQELLPTLRELGMAFYAFNPLAGGLLTGKHAWQDALGEVAEGRFKDNDSYMKRFWKKETFQALERAKVASDSFGIPLSESALRWMARHSALDGSMGDGIVLGCSSVAHLRSNLRSIGPDARPLPAEVLDAWEEAWAIAKPCCPRYDGYGSSAVARPSKDAPAQKATDASARSGAQATHSGCATRSRPTPEVDFSNVAIQEDGQAIDVHFSDGTAFRARTKWLVDSLPTRVGMDNYRISAHDIDKLPHAAAEEAKIQEGQLAFSWRANGSGTMTEEVPSGWLRAYMPSVGLPLNPPAEAAWAGRSECMARASGPKRCFASAEQRAEPWRPEELKPPVFDYSTLLREWEEQLRLLEAVAHPGLAIVRGAPATAPDCEGSVLEELSASLIGRMTQHAVRETRWWSASTSNNGLHVGGLDYDFSKPLDMHTDNSHYIEPNFLMYMHQPVGSSLAVLTDGMTISEELRRRDPEAWRLCQEVHVNHGLRHRLYSKAGAKRDVTEEGGHWEYELHSSAPLIHLHPDGTFEKVMHSETKRSVLELSYGQTERFYEAYKLFNEIVESDEFKYHYDWHPGEVLVLNNFRLLHGRAKITSPQRVLVAGYHIKEQVAHRHRMLRMRAAAHRTGLDESWFFRCPNTVLDHVLGVAP